MRTVIILIDTLRRDFIGVYNSCSMAKTPNINKFAKESLVFDNQFAGSMPCMPARRDLFTGRLNFLERSWGPIEPFDITFPNILKENGIYTHITTDHCHYMRIGGEGYLQQFNTWDYHRGQEGDPWVSNIRDPKWMPQKHYGKLRRQYQLNRTYWGDDPDKYPTPRTFNSACKWLDDNCDEDDFILMCEVFDPHEPFDVPSKYFDMYDSDYSGPYFECPNYKNVDVPEDAISYIRKRYAALLTMTDDYFGKLINKLKQLNMYDDTMVILTTDHGYFLGEKDMFGKNYMHAYNEVARLPLMIHYPGYIRSGEREDSITQNIDLMPTILDMYSLKIPDTVQGRSLVPLFTKEGDYDKKVALYGTHGLTVNITDGEYTYFRAPVKGNKPLYEYTCFPVTIRKYLGREDPADIQTGRYLRRTQYPVFKIPVEHPTITEQLGDVSGFVSDSRLYDIVNDPNQNKKINDKDLEEKCIRQLKEALKKYDSPVEQFERLELK